MLKNFRKSGEDKLEVEKRRRKIDDWF